jgi:hypothetical protein
MNAKRSAVIEKLRRLYPVAEAKICGECQQDRPLEEFRSDRRHMDGRVSTCQTCERAARKKLRVARRAALAVALEKWRREHPRGAKDRAR